MVYFMEEGEGGWGVINGDDDDEEEEEKEDSLEISRTVREWERGKQID